MSGIFFTRTNKTFRAWFQAVRSTGELRTGLVDGDFIVRIVNPTDTAVSSPTVTESTQKLGLYYFDIPSSYLTAQGIGDYGVSIQIDSVAGPSGAPNVRSADAAVLHVTQEDWDSLSGSLATVDGVVSGVWNANAATFNTTGSMGFLQNLIIQISGNTNANVIAADVWNAVAASYNTSGTFGWELNEVYASQSMMSLTVPSIVSGVWNANTVTFNTAGTFGALANQVSTDVNEILRTVNFHMSATLIASGIVYDASNLSRISSSIDGNPNQFNGMLLLLKSAASGNQTRIIDTYLTGVFELDPPATFVTASDALFVLSTQFFPSYGSIG